MLIERYVELHISVRKQGRVPAASGICGQPAFKKNLRRFCVFVELQDGHTAIAVNGAGRAADRIVPIHQPVIAIIEEHQRKDSGAIWPQ